MKTILKIIIALALLMVSIDALADKSYKESKENVKYKGENYTITYDEHFFSIWNKKYQSLYDNYGQVTDVLPQNVNYRTDAFMRGVTKFNQKVDSIAYRGVFTQEQASVLLNFKLRGRTFQTYYFKTEDNNYYCAFFQFDIKFKNIITIDKIYQMEQNLKNANINAGPQRFEKPNKKYFAY